MENSDLSYYKKLISEIVDSAPLSVEGIQQLLFKNPKSNGKIPRKSNVIEAYKQLKKTKQINFSEKEEDLFLQSIRMKRTRTLSGVTPVTVLTKPYPCPGQCVFCPSDYRMPKSYLRDEPGAQRAETNKFDPYLQTYNRLVAYTDIGHPTSKIELIILGGTWSFYPRDYQIWFVKRCLEAMNDFDFRSFPDTLDTNIPLPYDSQKLSTKDDRYNKVIAKAINNSLEEKSTWEELESVQKQNEKASSRCVGFVVETRPDYITPQELTDLRRLGVTKLQIGIQTLDDEILEKNKRGHTVAQSGDAVTLVRQAGYKIHLHWMPNLLGSNPEKDIQDFKKLFSDPRFKPDELKVYPCSLIQSAELMKYYKNGEWEPYTEEQLLYVLTNVMKIVPRYCRVTRMIRDISSNDIVTGNKKTNFRQLVDEDLKRKNERSMDIRSREIRNKNVERSDLKFKVTEYETAVSNEYFLEYCTDNELIAGFLRLSLPVVPNILSELEDSAIIREIHVYGQSVDFGETEEGKAQHLGLGKSLIDKACELSNENNFSTLSVISSIGTREYYRKNGFRDGTLYQHLSL